MHQSPSRLFKTPSWMHQSPSWICKAPSWMHQLPSWIYTTPSWMHQSPPWIYKFRIDQSSKNTYITIINYILIASTSTCTQYYRLDIMQFQKEKPKTRSESRCWCGIMIRVYKQFPYIQSINYMTMLIKKKHLEVTLNMLYFR